MGGWDYWGDIDNKGFEILSSLRSQQDNVESILMDMNTLTYGQHKKHWVEDTSQVTKCANLTPSEKETLNYIHSGTNTINNIRLEQEYITTDYLDQQLNKIKRN